MTSSNDVFPRKADPRSVPSTPTYDEALRICGREAAVTFIAALGLFAFFWGSIALFKDVHERFSSFAATNLLLPHPDGRLRMMQVYAYSLCVGRVFSER